MSNASFTKVKGCCFLIHVSLDSLLKHHTLCLLIEHDACHLEKGVLSFVSLFFFCESISLDFLFVVLSLFHLLLLSFSCVFLVPLCLESDKKTLGKKSGVAENVFLLRFQTTSASLYPRLHVFRQGKSLLGAKNRMQSCLLLSRCSSSFLRDIQET